MLSCPGEGTLRLLGTDALDDATFAAIEKHVEGCAECTAILERLARRRPVCPLVLASPEQWPRVPGFTIERELGRGAMGVVYLAVEEGLGRLVALKILRGAIGPDARSRARRRWLREAQAVSSIRHPNVVSLYDYGEANDWFYLVLEYVPGGTLKQRLKGPLPPRAAAVLVETVARAVGCFHGRGLHHLDLKPSNILLDCEQNAPWDQVNPMVSDFGVALSDSDAGPSETSLAGIRGTPSYMAPEQTTAPRTKVGPAADIHALGAIFFELLTGRPPFQGFSTLETLDQVRGQEPVPPRRLIPKVPRDLETIVLKCLEKSPARRYVSAVALADDLRRWLDGRPVTVRRIWPVERVWRWCRRNPVVSSMAAALALTIALSFVVLLSLFRNAQARQRSAEANYRIALNSVKDAASLNSQMLKQGASTERGPFEVLLRNLRSHQKQLYESHRSEPAARDQLVQLDLALASRLIRDGAFDEAETVLRAAERVVAETPKHSAVDVGFWLGGARARGLLGQIATKRQRFEEAATLFKQAIEKLGSLDSTASCPERELCLVEYQVTLGDILVSLGRPEEGERWLRKSAPLFAGLSTAEGFDPDFLLYQARMLRLLEGPENECEALRNAFRTYPGLPSIAVKLAVALLDSADSLPPGDRRQALSQEAWKTLVSVTESVEAQALRDRDEPGNIHNLALFYRYLGRALMNLGRREDAIAGLQRYMLLEQFLNRRPGLHSAELVGACEPAAMLARITNTPSDVSSSYPRSPALRDSARFIASTIGIDSTSFPEIAWALIVSEGGEAALCRRTNRVDRARDIVSGLEEFARQIVAQYPKDSYAHLALSEALCQVSKNAWRQADKHEVEGALRQAVSAAQQALTFDPRNTDAQRAIVDWQRRLAGLQTHQ
jgi:serine/threonine protein kinase/tetratricopeptide (TPR) repeat protein